MSKINLVYWNQPNFGDLLSPYIVSKLSGEKIQYKRGVASLRYSRKEIIQLIKSKDWDGLKEMLFNWQNSIVAVGSIINLGNSKSKVWGAGFMNSEQPFPGSKLYAVRGHYTREKLRSMGFNPCAVVGDPALLLPIIHKITPPELNNINILICIIPHWTEVDYFKERFGNKYTIIDFRTTKIEPTIEKIVNNNIILSTSLHGIIVAHAYGIPCIWIKKGYIHTDGIKFKDYFSSVGIQEYNGFTDIDSILQSQESVIEFFSRHKDISLPDRERIKDIQVNLLKVAPFKLLPAYRHL